VSRIRANSGPSAAAANQIVRTVQVVDGRKVVRYTNKQ
jgi:hypothetical protein